MQRVLKTSGTPHKTVPLARNSPSSAGAEKILQTLGTSPTTNKSLENEEIYELDLTFGSAAGFGFSETPKSECEKPKKKPALVKTLFSPEKNPTQNFTESVKEDEKNVKLVCEICQNFQYNLELETCSICLRKNCKSCNLLCAFCSSQICKKCLEECLECQQKICNIKCGSKCIRCNKIICKKCLLARLIKEKEQFLCLQCIKLISESKNNDDFTANYSIDEKPAFIRNAKDGKCFSFKGIYLGKFANNI